MMDRFADGIRRVIEKTGRGASLLIIVIMTTVTLEVISRYVFNNPTSWVWLLNKQLFGIFVLVSGSYALVQKSHIRIEMLHERFPPLVKRVVRWLTLAAALLFLGSLFWKSTVMGLDALAVREKATGVFPLPLYPLKLFMPVATALFLLGCIAVYSRKE